MSSFALIIKRQTYPSLAAVPNQSALVDFEHLNTGAPLLSAGYAVKLQTIVMMNTKRLNCSFKIRSARTFQFRSQSKALLRKAVNL